MSDHYISHYHVSGSLGRGGMGGVFRAKDTKLDRVVALKLLPKELANDSERRQRFLTEAKAASALNHPHVCTIYEIGETDDGQLFLAMEYLSGRTLAQCPEAYRDSPDTILSIGAQIADALTSSHANGVIHRDIKPSNIHIDDKGQIKLLDFGLAKRFLPLSPPRDGDTTELATKTGQILGTPSYMSPEQALGQPVDRRTDLFNVGLVLYQMTTGQLAFKGENFADTFHQILHAEPMPIPDSNPNTPTELVRIISKCLEKQPENRYQSADDLLVDLRRARRSEHTAHDSPPPPRNPQSTRPAVVGITTLCITALIAVFFLWPDTNAPIRHRLAVLPLDNLSPDPTDEYFAYGMREALDGKLAELSEVTLIGRTSVLKYKAESKDLDQIGNDLQVTSILDGSVQKTADKVVIRLQLIDVESKGTLWTQEFSRGLADVFAIQSEIAQQVATALKVQLDIDQADHWAKKPTDNLVAYQENLRGRYHLSFRTGKEIEKAIARFENAIDLDPNFALAHSGLANARALLPLYSRQNAKQHMAEAVRAANKAIRLDPTLAEAYAIRAWVKAFYEYDWMGAESDFQQAFKIDPKHPTNHHYYALHLCQLGNFTGAKRSISEAHRLDPTSFIINHTEGYIYHLEERYPEAIQAFDRNTALAERFDTRFLPTEWFIATVIRDQGDTSRAIEIFESVRPSFEQAPFYLGALGQAYVSEGRVKDAIEILNTLKIHEQQGLALSYDIASIELAMGNIDQAFQRLELALEERDFSIGMLRVDPVWKPLRSDSRFSELLDQMNLPTP